MEWVQLVLPQEGMLPALLCYRQSFGEDGCIHLQGMTQENFYEWLSCWQERMLGIECNQQWLYLALTCEDKVVGSAQVSREMDGYTHSVLLAPDGPPQLLEQIEQQLCDIMVKELTEGIEGTGVRATVIGEIGTSKDITETEAKVFRAASRAHAETGAPICTHTTLGTRGLEQLEIFKSFGVDLSRVVLSHIDLSADLDYMKRLLDQGVNIAFDTIGKCNYQPDVSRADWLSRLCAEGYDTQIVMSMDITRRSNFADRGGVGYSYLLDTFAPLASEAGVPDRAWENLLYRNALRIYKGQK